MNPRSRTRKPGWRAESRGGEDHDRAVGTCRRVQRPDGGREAGQIFRAVDVPITGQFPEPKTGAGRGGRGGLPDGSRTPRNAGEQGFDRRLRRPLEREADQDVAAVLGGCEERVPVREARERGLHQREREQGSVGADDDEASQSVPARLPRGPCEPLAQVPGALAGGGPTLRDLQGSGRELSVVTDFQ